MTSERSILDIAYDHIRNINSDYHDHASTRSSCYNLCGNSARGGGVCSECAEKDLAAITTPELAAQLHKAVKDRSYAVGEIFRYLEDK